MTIDYQDDGPDSLGRRCFFLDWVEKDGNKRSQIFFCNPEKYEKEIQDATNENAY